MLFEVADAHLEAQLGSLAPQLGPSAASAPACRAAQLPKREYVRFLRNLTDAIVTRRAAGGAEEGAAGQEELAGGGGDAKDDGDGVSRRALSHEWAAAEGEGLDLLAPMLAGSLRAVAARRPRGLVGRLLGRRPSPETEAEWVLEQWRATARRLQPGSSIEDDTLSFAQVAAALEGFPGGTRRGAAGEDAAKTVAALRALDADGDGVVGADDVKAALSSMVRRM